MLASAGSNRVALVIGNSAYEHAPPLKNPKNDAVAISKALKQVGFDVIMSLDKKYRDMPSVLSEFSQKLQTADIALLYYSGHGLQIHGRNYLVPTDASINSEIDVQFQTVRLDRILNIMEAGPKTKLVFLDACRDNPLARNLARSLKTRSSIIGRGLAQQSAEAGMLIAYATAPGTVARDGASDKSPFTSAVLTHIRTPNLDITRVLRRVRLDVMKETQNQQVPWTNSSLTYGFVFNQKKPEDQQAINVQKSQPAHTTGVSAEQYAWGATSKVGTCSAYQHFANSYKSSFYAGLANSWIDKNCPDTANQKPVLTTKLVEKDPTSLSRTTTSPPAPDPKTLARSLQTELKRVGCLTGIADGVWGSGSKRAVLQYNKYASYKISVEQPSQAAIKRLQGIDKPVCEQTAQQGAYLPGNWNCQAQTEVFLAQKAFFQKKGKKVLVEKCHGKTVITKSSMAYRSMFDQKCRAKTLISFGTPPEKASWVKSNLWFKNGILYGQAYQTSKKNKMVQGWNPVARFDLTDTTLKFQVSGRVTDKGVKYRFTSHLACRK